MRAAGHRLVEDAELAYAMTRYREIHDFLHVLTGLPPTVEGELALKTLEAVRTRAITRLSPSAGVAGLTMLIGAQVQTGLPMAALSALAGPFSMRQPERIQRWYRRAAPAVTAWAATCGVASVDPSHCTWGVERRGEFSPLGPAGCFLGLGFGLGLVGTVSSRR